MTKRLETSSRLQHADDLALAFVPKDGDAASASRVLAQGSLDLGFVQAAGGEAQKRALATLVDGHIMEPQHSVHDRSGR